MVPDHYGKIRVDRRGIPDDLVDLKVALGERMISRGTRYYIRKGAIVYACWRDSRTVLESGWT